MKYYIRSIFIYLCLSIQAFAQDDKYVYDPWSGSNSVRDIDSEKPVITFMLLEDVIYWAKDVKSNPGDINKLAVCFDSMLQARAFISQRNPSVLNEKEKRLYSTINKLLEPFSLSYHRNQRQALFDLLRSPAYSKRVEDFRNSIDSLTVSIDADK